MQHRRNRHAHHTDPGKEGGAHGWGIGRLLLARDMVHVTYCSIKTSHGYGTCDTVLCYLGIWPVKHRTTTYLWYGTSGTVLILARDSAHVALCSEVGGRQTKISRDLAHVAQYYYLPVIWHKWHSVRTRHMWHSTSTSQGNCSFGTILQLARDMAHVSQHHYCDAVLLLTGDMAHLAKYHY